MYNAGGMLYTSKYLVKIIQDPKETNLCFQKFLTKTEGSKKKKNKQTTGPLLPTIPMNWTVITYDILTAE